ncbi:MAG: hypothetical protein MI976_28110 [Pseudomonadales bacterium]|nr:hypothetical protein [Pseudomonadales bacterium]
MIIVAVITGERGFQTMDAQDDTVQSSFIKYKDSPLMPSRNLFDRFFHERRLRDFFCKLSSEGISDLEDISQYTEKEVLEIAPLGWLEKRILKSYQKNGFIHFKPE